MRVKVGSVAGLLGCIALFVGAAACGTPQASPPPPGSSSVPSSSSVSDAELKAWVEAARLTSAVVGADAPVRDQSGMIGMVRMCDEALSSDAHLVYSHHATWSGTNIKYVEHAVFAYDAPGSDMVSAVRDRAEDCRTYELAGAGDSAQMTNLGEYAMTIPDGIDDAYAFCELSVTLTPASHSGEEAFICTAVFSRGALAMTVRVFGDEPSVEAAQSALDLASSMAVPALVNAVPV
jgi:hypothetical protein